MRWEAWHWAEVYKIAPECPTLEVLAERLSHQWGRVITKQQLSMAHSRALKAGRVSRALGSVLGAQKAPQARSEASGCLVSDDVIGPDTVTYYEPPEAPPPGSVSAFGLWSDLHIGSDDCNERAIREFQKICADHGVKNMLCSGDWCDGTYTKRGGQHEQNYVGLDSQISATLDLLDQRIGVRHWLIDGNHEHTFYTAGGSRPGEHLEAAAIANGRSDIRFLGYPKAQVELRGIKFELVHYKRGVRRAHVLHLQNRSDASLPDVLVGGHYHIDDCTRARGVKCIQPGAFQNETDFMMGSEAHPTGGGILWVKHTERGNVFWYAFFEFDRQGNFIGRS